MALGAVLTMVCASVASVASRAADAFPERKTVSVTGAVIEYSAGDEAFVTALSKQLPLTLSTSPQSAPALPVTVADLRARRAEILKQIAEWLAVPPTTPKLGQTFDAFSTGYALMQTAKLPNPTHFALWRKPELMARLATGQDVAGFTRTSDGGIQFSVGANFEFHEGEPAERGVERLQEGWKAVVWPIKIGEEPAKTPDEEIAERLAGLRENAAELANFQSTEIQRLAVMMVLHESVESTLVSEYIRSPDRRWFCEGVANYVAFKVLEKEVGGEGARQYYDVDAELKKFEGVKSRVDLEHWPVVEDPRAKAVPPDVNAGSYAFSTRRVFDAFGGKEDLLPAVLADIRKAGIEKTDLSTVAAVYRARTGREMSPAPSN